MKMNLRKQIALGAGLVVIAVVLHLIHFMIFGHPEETLAFLGKKIAFVPLEVLFITLIVHQLLNIHERSVLVRKMNMLVGSFFSELGNDLLARLNNTYQLSSEGRERFKIDGSWKDKDFDRAMRAVEDQVSRLQIDSDRLEGLCELLQPKRQFLLLLIGNPNLLEHEPFTDLFWAVFHLMEELSRREDLHNLPQSDLSHLSRDATRVYSRLLQEWIRYMKHLKDDYPYLYSLEIRINPFDVSRSAVVAA